MFFKQVLFNASKNRRTNGLFFASLIIAVISFYSLLSLESQDVVNFLSTLESDAVQKLLTLIPLVYCVSLFFVFFLVYFACKYQTEARKPELAMYLMLGMKRSRMFFMLLCETLVSSLVSLLAGLPAALLLTEGVSLLTSKIIGLSIISHSFSFSLKALLWTVCGFVAVQVISMLVISLPVCKAEPAVLLHGNVAKKQSKLSQKKSTVCFVLGLILLGAAYYLGVFKLNLRDVSVILIPMAGLLVCGVSGTFLLYKGLGGFIGKRLDKKFASSRGLDTFNGRQLQESVANQHISLAVSSLLMLVSISAIIFGISVGAGRANETRTVDLSVLCNEQQADKIVNDTELKNMIDCSYPVYLDAVFNKIDYSEITKEFYKLPEEENYADSFHLEYLLSLSSYNNMMTALGKPGLTLQGNTAALYSTLGENNVYSVLNKILKNNVSISITGTEYELLPELYTDKIIADRSITLYAAIIVPDELYNTLGGDSEPFCVNLHIKNSITEEVGLMNAIQRANEILDKTGVEYDSYLKGIGRNLFYSVAASYLTVYLGVLFLLISNTVIGVKFLIQQRDNKHRYVTLLMLGADIDSLCRSAKKQINMYFISVLSVAAFSSLFAVTAMLINLTTLSLNTTKYTVILIGLFAFAAFVLTEIIYISAVKRFACREIRELEITDRE